MSYHKRIKEIPKKYAGRKNDAGKNNKIDSDKNVKFLKLAIH